MRGVLLFLAFALCVAAKAQQFNIKTSIYFETDSFLLIKEHYPKLDKFADTAKKLSIKGILLRGNTDADADSLYNIRLSAKRAASVKKYLVQRGIIDTLIHIDYYGENKPIADNASDKGKQKNRRVDIILSATLPIKKAEIVLQDTIMDEPEAAKDTCDKDTTYTLPAGTTVVMNLCDFLAQKGCFTVVEYLTPESIQSAGLLTESNTGELLQSGGMLNIKTCNNECLPRPITIRILINDKLSKKDYSQMNLYNGTANGWAMNRGSNAEIKVVKIGKQKYFEFMVQCPGMKNFDKPLWLGCGNGGSARKYKLKLPKGYKLIESRISGYDELWQSSLGFQKGKRKSKTCFFCGKLDKNLKLYIKAINGNGDTVIVNYKPIKDLKFKYRLFPDRCIKPLKKQCGNFLIVFGYRKSKFKIREKDFEEIKNNQ